MKIYVASSWRNNVQPLAVHVLREAGHEVYDFKNPPNGSGFHWSEVGLSHSPTVSEYVKALEHPRSIDGYRSDMGAMEAAEGCLLVLPSGRSAHLEAGWFAGQNRDLVILTRDGEEPELMAKMSDFITDSLDEVVRFWSGRA